MKTTFTDITIPWGNMVSSLISGLVLGSIAAIIRLWGRVGKLENDSMETQKQIDALQKSDIGQEAKEGSIRAQIQQLQVDMSATRTDLGWIKNALKDLSHRP